MQWKRQHDKGLEGDTTGWAGAVSPHRPWGVTVVTDDGGHGRRGVHCGREQAPGRADGVWAVDGERTLYEIWGGRIDKAW